MISGISCVGSADQITSRAPGGTQSVAHRSYPGWPDTFARVQKMIPLLTGSARNGGDPADSFGVVVPSMPGLGFSDCPAHAA